MPVRKYVTDAPKIFERDIAFEIGRRRQFRDSPRVQIEKLAARAGDDPSRAIGASQSQFS